MSEEPAKETEHTEPAEATKEAEMTKKSDADFEKMIAEAIELKAKKSELETLCKKANDAILKQLALRNSKAFRGERFGATITHVSESWIVDTDAVKAAGLFDKYKKVRAGYDKLALSVKRTSTDGTPF